jgi:hypothetical protein
MQPQQSPKRRPIRIPRELEPLVRELAELSEEARRDVFAAVEEAKGRNRATVAWESFKAASGIVSLGGDAVLDCDRLYDG